MELALSKALDSVLRVVAVEVEAFALANLVAKAEQGKLAIEAMYPDVKTFPAERFSGCFDIITAGYPCQPFSNAGRRKGTKDPRHLWPYIEEHIRAIRPVWCFFENVSGHLTLGFDEVFKSLRGLGYKVEAGLFTAAEVGAPHKRERLFILGYSEHNGYVAEQVIRGDEKTGDHWRKKESSKARQPTGTDRPPDATSAQGSTGGGELADAGRNKRRGRPTVRPIKSEPCGSQKADEKAGGGGKSKTEFGPERKLSDESARPEELADASGEGLPGRQGIESPPPQGRQEPIRYARPSRSSWPARPDEPQYEWEEPRTVVAKPNRGRSGKKYELCDSDLPTRPVEEQGTT